MSDPSRNPSLPPFKKGGLGGFLARVGLIQNAALDPVNSLWPFPINEGCPAIAGEIQALAKGHTQIMSEQENFIKPEI